jgi:Fe-S-cluster containining protein
MLELRRKDPVRAEAVAERARLWIERNAAEFPGDHLSGVLGTGEAEQEAFEDFANEEPCPALNPASGSCDLYLRRPMTCRLFGPPVAMEGGFACCELGFQEATEEEIAACAMDIPHALEADLIAETGSEDETVVAYALVSPGIE